MKCSHDNTCSGVSCSTVSSFPSGPRLAGHLMCGVSISAISVTPQAPYPAIAHVIEDHTAMVTVARKVRHPIRIGAAAHDPLRVPIRTGDRVRLMRRPPAEKLN